MSAKPIIRGVGLFVLANLVIFVLYRAFFLHHFVEGISPADVFAVCVYGCRLDSALLSIELCALLTLSLATRYLRLRAMVVVLVILTAAHFFVAVANLIFFSERNQHLWEMLFANIAKPSEVLNACEPYLKEAPIATAVVVVLAMGLIYLGVRGTRSLGERKVDLWSSRRRIGLAIAAWAVLFTVPLDRVDFAERKGWRLGWIPLPAASHYYMRFESYVTNQSVINPVHDFVRFYLPAQFTSGGRAHEERLDAQEALSISQKLLKVGVPMSEQFPMQKVSHPLAGAGFHNVALIQVEGLTQSLINRKEGGKVVMPYLSRLAHEAVCVPNVVQNYNATDGGALSTITGTHKAFFNKDWKYFLPDEVNGYFASLPRILGNENYRHLAFFGFRNRREDFRTFLHNQGYAPMDNESFKELKIDDSGNPLGLYDHVLFDVALDVLRDCPHRFSAYLMTTTTHSPWAIPEGEPAPFESDRLNAFHYVDRCIEEFVANMRRSHPAYSETLFVISADHTSVTFSQGLMERLRIPLILFGEGLDSSEECLHAGDRQVFSQVDIIPTILDLMEGSHIYSGLGRSILTADGSGPGAISSNRYLSLYLKGGFAFQYSPFAPVGLREQLFAIQEGEIIENDISSENRFEFDKLSKEFFALYETSDRLTKERRFFPFTRK